MSDPMTTANAERDWWMRLEPMLDAKLHGWSYFGSATFISNTGGTIRLYRDTAEAMLTALATARQDGFDAALAIATRVANELTASGTGNQHAERAQGAWQVHTAMRGGG